MGCCDNGNNGRGHSVLGQVRDISEGYALLSTGQSFPYADDRLAICRACEKHTWLSTAEYVSWLAAHGIQVLTNLGQLQTLPELPRYDRSRDREHLFCRICKCYLRAKTVVIRLECPLAKWPKLDPQTGVPTPIKGLSNGV